MPPQIAALLEDRQKLLIAGGGLLAVIILVVVLMLTLGGGGAKKTEDHTRKLLVTEKTLAKVDSLGRAIEIQALMSRQGINILTEEIEGGKVSLTFDEKANNVDRDKAVITLVQSGLMDKNVGLEVFDKSDMMASREEKRIKLLRARNGELSRLIRKIDPIQDASVFISMPEPSIFKADEVATSATVQVTLSAGERLTKDKVRSIVNLLVGSIENLTSEHVSLTDTNGTVYNSVLDTQDELENKLEERDKYMEQKVHTQLDRLLGSNKYAVTVSTYLREAPKTEMTLDYNPDKTAVQKSSVFAETMGDGKAKAGGPAGGPVSTIVPDEIESKTSESKAGVGGKAYNRTGQEMEYNAGKRQVTEDFRPGMVEEISVALTVDPDVYPRNISLDEFKSLVGKAASPLVKPENVSIIEGKPTDIMPINPEASNKSASIDIPWWLWLTVGGLALFTFLAIVYSIMKPGVDPRKIEQQDRQLDELRELAHAQSQQLQNAQVQTQQMLQAQQHNITQIAGSGMSTMGGASTHKTTSAQQGAFDLKEALDDIKRSLQDDAEEALTSSAGEDALLSDDIRSWVEKKS
jgi:flagellar M-ring protein FliF